MIFNCLTLYPEIIRTYRQTGIIGRGHSSGAITINAFDIRDFTLDKHGRVDDYAYGGADGMLMTPQPVYDCVMAVKCGRDVPVVFFTPRGRVFSTTLAKEYSALKEVILLCGHYEGIDQRALELTVDDEISLGDYIVTGGHIPAMCFMDAVSRYVPGVLGGAQNAYNESFDNNLLEYDQFTRPAVFRGKKVPDILLSGNPKIIGEYKKEQSLRITEKYRPDLLEKSSGEGKKEPN